MIKQVLTAPPGHRNFSIAIWAMVLMAFLGWRAGDSLHEMGPVFASIGTSVALIIAGRAANKWAQNGKE